MLGERELMVRRTQMADRCISLSLAAKFTFSRLLLLPVKHTDMNIASGANTD